MYDLLHCGVDTIDVAFAGALSKPLLDQLHRAREEALVYREPTLIELGPGKISMHVYEYGKRGGYAFTTDTGPLGARWYFKNNDDPKQWNIFVSPRSTLLLATGFQDTCSKLMDDLVSMGATITGHSVNRVDYAMDFKTEELHLSVDQFVAHSHAKVHPRWSKSSTAGDSTQPSAVLRGRRIESVTIGKMPGRQVIVYDKRREAIEHNKRYWFLVWGVSDKSKNHEIWRLELRFGKRELNDRWKLKTLADIETCLGDLILSALRDVRYVADVQQDTNVTRQDLHPLWVAARLAADRTTIASRTGLTRDQVQEFEREVATRRYEALTMGCALGLVVCRGFSGPNAVSHLPMLIARWLRLEIRKDPEKALLRLRKSEKRLKFIAGKQIRPPTNVSDLDT